MVVMLLALAFGLRTIFLVTRPVLVAPSHCSAGEPVQKRDRHEPDYEHDT